MLLTSYVQACEPKVLQLWVGVFDAEEPRAPTFRIDDADAAPEPGAQLRAIHDSRTGPNGSPLNHRGIYRFAVLEAGRSYRVEIQVGNERIEIVARTLPEAVPQVLDGSFNVLLCSCYYQPEDASGLVGTIVSQIQLQPHLTLMMGDQIYGDLPLFEDLPEDPVGLARALGDKYRVNWLSSQLGVGGLGRVLSRAPVACIADDHEFWNNYPFKQKQLPNTGDDEVRKNWAAAARALFEDYQTDYTPPAGGAAGTHKGALRFDIDPLKLLMVDMRCDRDDEFSTLMPKATLDALKTWADDLVEAKASGTPCFGVLSSGQALFIDPPQDDSKKRRVDAEMGNYRQFTGDVLQQLERLADESIPVVYLTGDVHWGRTARATDLHSNRTLLYEVIASPSRLIDVPFLDTGKEFLGFVTGIFTKPDPWPRHGEPDRLPDRFGSNRRFKLERKQDGRADHEQRGDQIAIISFSRSGSGVEFQVSYYAISTDKELAKSRSSPKYELKVI